MTEVGGFVGGVDAGAHDELHIVGPNRQPLGDPTGTERRKSPDLIDLSAGETEPFDGIALDELERQDWATIEVLSGTQHRHLFVSHEHEHLPDIHHRHTH